MLMAAVWRPGRSTRGPRRLDAGLQQDRDPRLRGNALQRPAQQVGRALRHLPRRVTQQIDGVFDAASAFERARVDRYPQRLRQLLEGERLGLPGELGSALEEATVHVVPYESIAERDERPLAESGLVAAEAVQHHLPAEVDHGHLHGLGVGHALVHLQQHRHRQHGRGHR